MDFDEFAGSILLKISTRQIPSVYIVEFVLPYNGAKMYKCWIETQIYWFFFIILNQFRSFMSGERVFGVKVQFGQKVNWSEWHCCQKIIRIRIDGGVV